MDILFSIIGLGLLVLGAEIIIRGSVSFGRKINISLFAIGVVIVAGGTSLPELASSINAVLNDFSDLALGAVVGSNIANLILVMATTTLIFPIVNINKNQIIKDRERSNDKSRSKQLCLNYLRLKLPMILG